ncbi:L-lysine 6-oxidase [Caballeronia calidae]|uniref:L-lysine 6-oxidase n=1 Tax=Caballeronia calidae TaxID=1777139 RepID=A0A158EG43_9BURK|nr:LodA/GoxA family CTQ-dependent oxidase [Caballeronia calidae]SAL05784.1 L-lysine 6-oxidase [Caballeronia calidae]
MYRDGKGNLKRQAARFRIFKCTRDNAGVLKQEEEIFCRDEVRSIVWSVHLRNRKGAAERLIPSKVAGRSTSEKTPRNGSCTTRGDLIIDPGPRSLQVVSGEASPGSKYFDTGQFIGKRVPLGEICTDVQGRLLVVGGNGVSFSVPPHQPLTELADNNDWCDDTSDGPVTATIVMRDGGESIDVVPSWVIVAPPDFAPDISSFVTLYDICIQAWMEKEGRDLPRITNFYRDVLPILRRARGYRWVFAGVMRSEVPDKHGSWSDERSDLFSALAQPSDIAPPPGSVAERAIRYRQMLFAHLRDPDTAAPAREVAMPRLYDGSEKPVAATGAAQVLALTPWQYRHMRNWANGEFENDRTPFYEFECDALDRIALQACSGGAFYPGIEASSIMKDKRLYIARCRIDHCSEIFHGEFAKGMQPADDVDCGAGCITEGLAVPWQADFYKCRMEGEATWWPATHPDKVLVLHPDERNLDLPADALSERMERWDFGINGNMEMVNRWASLGMVKAKRLTKANGWSIPATADDIVKDAKGEIIEGTVYVEEERVEAHPVTFSPSEELLRKRLREPRTERAKRKREGSIG